MTANARDEVVRGKRFAFGENWRRFLSVLTDGRIHDAQESLRAMLEVDSLAGKRFLDVGCGSGLFSLAARRLGAAVTSFDYDPQSVACARELKRRYHPDDPAWEILQGSVLDEGFVRDQGEFDIVYSWGVLHHTGEMWRALEHAALPVRHGGRLFIAIYNDQGAVSRKWLTIKRFYCSGVVGRVLVCGLWIPYTVARGLLGDVLKGRNPLQRYLRPTTRGMSLWYDWFDWLGGLPFEVARPEAVVEFYRKRGFSLSRLVTVGGGHANNEFVLVRS